MLSIPKKLAQLVSQHKKPANLAIIGPKGYGKKFFSYHLAKLAFCQDSIACGECSSCLNIINGKHPDFSFIDVETTNVLLADINKIQNLVYSQPLKSKYKIIILNKADNLTTEAANSFLKTLEEPPDSCLIVFLLSSELNALPTIISRLLKIYLPRPTNKIINSVLLASPSLDIKDDEQDKNLWLGLMRAGIRDDWLSKADQFNQLRICIINNMLNISQISDFDFIEENKLFVQDFGVEQVLEIYLSLFHDMCCFTVNKDDMIQNQEIIQNRAEIAPWLIKSGQLTNSRSIDVLWDLSIKLVQSLIDIKSNSNLNLTFENYMLYLLDSWRRTFTLTS